MENNSEHKIDKEMRNLEKTKEHVNIEAISVSLTRHQSIGTDCNNESDLNGSIQLDNLLENDIQEETSQSVHLDTEDMSTNIFLNVSTNRDIPVNAQSTNSLGVVDKVPSTILFSHEDESSFDSEAPSTSSANIFTVQMPRLPPTSFNQRQRKVSIFTNNKRTYNIKESIQESIEGSSQEPTPESINLLPTPFICTHYITVPIRPRMRNGLEPNPNLANNDNENVAVNLQHNAINLERTPSLNVVEYNHGDDLDAQESSDSSDPSSDD